MLKNIGLEFPSNLQMLTDNKICGNYPRNTQVTFRHLPNFAT